MKKALLSAAVMAALVSPALAADLPSHKAPPPVFVPPPPLWTGFYVGLNAGGTFGGSNTVFTSAAPFFAAPTFINEGIVGSILASGAQTINNAAFIGGGQVGYNYQFYNNFVVGLEADIQGVAGGNQTANRFGASGVPLFPLETMFGGVSVNKSLDYLGTVRGRLGFLATPTLMVFGSGGLAYGGVTSSTSIFQSDTLAVPGCFFCTPYGGVGTFSDTRVGWTAGGGVEWMFMPNWSAKVEYLYYDLGAVTYTASPLLSVFTFGGPAWAIAAQSNVRFNGHIVRAGVNYHFNWGAPAPVVAKF